MHIHVPAVQVGGAQPLQPRQVSAWGRDGDILVAISTSGNSANVLAAAAVAKQKNMKIIAFTGSKPSKLKEVADICLAIPSTDTPQIQQAHITIIHSICDQVEKTIK